MWLNKQNYYKCYSIVLENLLLVFVGYLQYFCLVSEFDQYL